MALSRRIGPLAQFVGELCLSLVPIVFVILRLNLSLRYKIGGVVVVTAILGVGTYLLVYRNNVALRGERSTDFLDQHLEFVVSDYAERYDPSYDVRANVMLPQEKRTLSQQNSDEDQISPHSPLNVSYESYRFLRIAFCAGGGSGKDIQKHAAGERDETTTEWRIDAPVEGNCGRAYTTGETRVAGRPVSENEWSDETTDEQDIDTEKVNSILSVPIRKHDDREPVGVLNIDASAPLAETNFRDEAVQTEVEERYADNVGIAL